MEGILRNTELALNIDTHVDSLLMFIEYGLGSKYFITLSPLITIASQQNRYYHTHLADEKTASEILSNCSGYAANQQGR